MTAITGPKGADKHMQCQGISNWNRAVDAIEATTAYTKPAAAIPLSSGNGLELKRQQKVESGQADVLRMGSK